MSAHRSQQLYQPGVATQIMASRNPWTTTVQGEKYEWNHNADTVGSPVHFNQDSEIYGEGDEAEVFFKVVSGIIRTCKFLASGRRQIDTFFVSGDVFGFEAGRTHTLSAEAVCGCTVISYHRRGLEVSAGQSQELSHQLFSYAMQTVARSREHSLLLGRGSAIEKVAAFLYEWAETPTDGKTITLAVSREDIADYLGLTVETVSRMFSALARENLIRLITSRQILINNAKALNRLAFPIGRNRMSSGYDLRVAL